MHAMGLAYFCGLVFGNKLQCNKLHTFKKIFLVNAWRHSKYSGGQKECKFIQISRELEW
jgi:hypothetical protein